MHAPATTEIPPQTSTTLDHVHSAEWAALLEFAAPRPHPDRLAGLLDVADRLVDGEGAPAGDELAEVAPLQVFHHQVGCAGFRQDIGIDHPHGAGWRESLLNLGAGVAITAIVPRFGGTTHSLEERHSTVPRFETVAQLVDRGSGLFDGAIICLPNDEAPDAAVQVRLRRDRLQAAGLALCRRLVS